MQGNQIITVVLTLFVFAWCEVGGGQTAADANLVKANIPASFKSMKDSTGAVVSVGNGIGYQFEVAEFDGAGKGRFLVVLYKGGLEIGNNLCELSVIKVVGTKGTVMPKATLNFSEELTGCAEIELKDIDGDGRVEVLVKNANSKGQFDSPLIFKWNGKNLVDLTPVVTEDGMALSAFRNMSISGGKEGKSSLLIDSPMASSLDRNTRVLAVINGKVTLLGTYSFYKLYPKIKTIAELRSETLALPAGTYNLEIKNRSADLTKAVRAQVQVGANIVIKPNAMCAGPAPKGYKPPNDGDGNDDKNKGCVPRKSTYVTIILKGNEVVKVTGYGATGSYLEISLLKK
ncbi:hypothetical protein [Bdellovibrio sp. GT3]|uniref:hypothetical protein n=1 Tax=Bdellovibrio sp. GT3 TaxID=3136282 RepID=UPI0030F05155